jgi:hypothetical protein
MLRSLSFLSAATLIVGFAAAQVSRNCELLSRRTRSGSTGYAGVWGYVAPDGREFAAVGNRNGTWIVETTDPRNPVERGSSPDRPAPGARSTATASSCTR